MSKPRSTTVASGDSTKRERTKGERTKGERTRHAIVVAAVQEFGQRGYRSTSIASVARAIDRTPAALYPYFSTKHELFLASADYALRQLLDEAERKAATSPLPWMTRFRTILTDVEHHPMVWRVLSEESPALVRECLQLPSLRSFVASIGADIDVLRAGTHLASGPATDVIANGLETVFLGLLLLRVRAGLDAFDERVGSVGALLLPLLRPIPPVDTAKADTAKD